MRIDYLLNDLEDYLEQIDTLLFRIYDESVPLFSSNRLTNVHKLCGDFIPQGRALKQRVRKVAGKEKDLYVNN